MHIIQYFSSIAILCSRFHTKFVPVRSGCGFGIGIIFGLGCGFLQFVDLGHLGVEGILDLGTR